MEEEDPELTLELMELVRAYGVPFGLLGVKVRASISLGVPWKERSVSGTWYLHTITVVQYWKTV